MQRVLGPQLREARRSKRIKQRDLAETLGISAAYLNLIEHDKRRIAGKLLNDIMRELDIDKARSDPQHQNTVSGNAATDRALAGRARSNSTNCQNSSAAILAGPILS